MLLQAFSTFGPVSEARVMWDMKTGRSRGYGFVAYRDRADADRALSSMDGEWLGSRAIRCNWANPDPTPAFIAPCAFHLIADVRFHHVCLGLWRVVRVDVVAVDEEMGRVPF